MSHVICVITGDKDVAENVVGADLYYACILNNYFLGDLEQPTVCTEDVNDLHGLRTVFRFGTSVVDVHHGGEIAVDLFDDGDEHLGDILHGNLESVEITCTHLGCIRLICCRRLVINQGC